jgi:hypothetical protein
MRGFPVDEMSVRLACLGTVVLAHTMARCSLYVLTAETRPGNTAETPPLTAAMSGFAELRLTSAHRYGKP